ncbi:MAG: acetylxylan esterase [Anaerolineae bacterium]|nr:acetylxylan esterase [Anaerolineae bacterium]
MNNAALRQQIADFLGFTVPQQPVPFVVHSAEMERGYSRSFITYTGDEGDAIAAYLLLPEGSGPFSAVVAHHQHNGERHLGKSEVCGLVGDPLQAFGPKLAQRGIAVLAPDSICFEDRRKNVRGVEVNSADTMQHFNELCYRLLRGDTLMRKVLDDSARAVSMLLQHPAIDASRIGILGHSYGGNTVLFHAALDERIRFACSSGAACSYAYKMAHGYGIEMAEVIPDFATRFDIVDLVTCFAPRPALIVSATDDWASADAEQIVALVRAVGAGDQLDHLQFAGDHPLTQTRFDAIVAWVLRCSIE